MDLYLLPGNSLNNKEWIESLRDKLSELFDNIHIQYYDHWESGKEVIDVNIEARKLEKNFKNGSLIIAKSAGILVALTAMAHSDIKPSKFIFIGTPIHWARRNGIHIDVFLTDLNFPSLFIQAKDDPMTTIEELKQLLDEKWVENYTLAEIAGDNHDYEDLAKIKDLVKNSQSKTF